MENRKSLLNATSVKITDKLSLRIPTVGEILEDEQSYYNIISSITATPFQYMVQLDDMGIDYTTINDYELFIMLFQILAKSDLSILFGDLNLSDIGRYKNNKNNSIVLYSSKNDVIIDELVYSKIVKYIRKINNLKRENRKPGNEEAKQFRIKL